MRSPGLGVAMVLAVALGTGACEASSLPTLDRPGVQNEAPARDLDTARLPTLTAASGATFVGVTPRTGNRFFEGSADLTASAPMTLATDHPVTWLLAAPLEPAEGDLRATLWVGGDGTGGVSAFVVLRRTDDTTEVVGIDAGLLGSPGGSPSLEVASDGAWAFAGIAEQAPDAPVRVLGNRRFAVPAAGGLSIDGVLERSIEPLPDAVAVASSAGLVAVLSGPTDVYDHAVLGDPLEAGAVSLVRDGVPSTDVVAEVGVFEGRAPLWADLDADGLDDLLVARSNDDVGAAIVVHRASESITGEITFEASRRVDGQPIGRGGRWRHLIAVAPLPVDGNEQPHVVEIVTPHLNRILLVSRLEGDTLVPVLELRTDLVSHTIGSRNLDRAGVFDANGDGRPDLVAATRDGRLGLYDLQTGDAEWVDLDASPGSNLVVTPASGDGRLAVGFGTAAGIVIFNG